MQRTLISSKSAEGGRTVPPVRPFSRCFFLAETSSGRGAAAMGAYSAS